MCIDEVPTNLKSSVFSATKGFGNYALLARNYPACTAPSLSPAQNPRFQLGRVKVALPAGPVMKDSGRSPSTQ